MQHTLYVKLLLSIMRLGNGKNNEQSFSDRPDQFSPHPRA